MGFKSLHDFLLAKEIVDTVLRLKEEKKLGNIKLVSLEIGSGSVPRDHQHAHEHDEHLDELNMENVQFGLESVARNTALKDVKFEITKVEGNSWEIVGIEV